MTPADNSGWKKLCNIEFNLSLLNKWNVSLINRILRVNKFVGTFFSTGSIAAGQETTALTCMPFFVHMGMIYVPMGGKFEGIGDNSVVHGGSSWGAGTIAGDGSRQPSQLELDFAKAQGKTFFN